METTNMPDAHWPKILPGKPACYRIAVTGRLDEQWSGRLGEMRIASQQHDDQQAVTILTGEVKDQADLIGILNTLYQLRMNVLAVICEPGVEPEDDL